MNDKCSKCFGPVVEESAIVVMGGECYQLCHLCFILYTGIPDHKRSIFLDKKGHEKCGLSPEGLNMLKARIRRNKGKKQKWTDIQPFA